MSDISKNARIIAVSDITDRVDELRAERAAHDKISGVERDEDGKVNWALVTEDGEPIAGSWEAEESDDAEELAELESLLESLDNCGSGHEWGGNRYPSELIAEYHFATFAQQQAEECGDISKHAGYIVVDWEATANGLKQDYREVDYNGSAYWHRV